MEFIIKYWSQIAVILSILIGGVSYFFKLYFESKNKKQEIIFNLVKAKKIEQLKEFYKSYVEFYSLLENLEFYGGQNRKVEESQIRTNIIEPFKNLKSNLMYLKIFLNQDECNSFNELEETLDNFFLKLDFSTISRNIHGNIPDKDLQKELEHIRDVVRKTEIPKLLEKIEVTVKKDFGII